MNKKEEIARIENMRIDNEKLMIPPKIATAQCGCLACKDGVCDCHIDPVLSLMHKMAVGESYTVLSEALRAARKEGFAGDHSER